jgi:uncharacterized protein YdcH (DUF465 family)
MAERLEPKALEFFSKCEKQQYSTQAKLYLNAFWQEDQGRAEEIFQFWQKYCATDLFLKGLNPTNTSSLGTELDEHGFHVFLEKNIKPMTIIEARTKLKEADVTFDGKVSLIEFLLWYYKRPAKEFWKRAPEDPTDAAPMSPELRAAMSALNAARAEIQKIEDEKSRLEDEIAKGSGIKSSKAKNELSQLLSRDQTDLNRALLTAEAAVRKLGGPKSDVPPGTIWWLNREVEEMKKYKPKSKQ